MLEPILFEAGKIALALREAGLQKNKKTDGTWVTNADEELSLLLTQFLRTNTPHEVISEEGMHDEVRPETYWLIDPIDGTSNFLRGSDDFAIVLCLMEAEAPTFSIAYLPAREQWYWATRGEGAYRATPEGETKLECKPIDRSTYSVRSKVHIGEPGGMSTAANYWDVAQGKLGCFIESEVPYWDLCPCALILREAGGIVVDSAGKNYLFKPESLMTGTVFAGHPDIVRRVLREMNQLDDD